MAQKGLLTGQTIGKYRIEGLLGEGGMASVYKGYHIELDLPIALKVLQPSVSGDDSVRSRFRQEAKLQFKFRHPNLVRVIDLFEEQGMLGMVMDWVKGEDLEQYMARSSGALRYEEVRRIFLPVLDAVAYAHEHGVVHRDLKPSNILLEGKQSKEFPKVMDFGIAKSLVADEEGFKTKTGVLIGTPYYLSPEQANGSKNIDHRSDIYSLGVMLYQMITGNLPFVGDTAINIIVSHLTQEPPPLSQFVTNIPDGIAEVISRSMEKKADRRYHTCEEFSEALSQVLPLKGAATIIPGGRSEIARAPSEEEIMETAFVSGNAEEPITFEYGESPTPPLLLEKKTSNNRILLWSILALLGVFSLVWALWLDWSNKNKAQHPIVRVRTLHLQPNVRSKQVVSTAPLTSPRKIDLRKHMGRGSVEPIPKTRVKRRIIFRRSVRRPIQPWSARDFRRCRRCVSRNTRSNLGVPSMLSAQNRYRNTCTQDGFLRIAKRCARRCSRQYTYYCVAYLKQVFKGDRGIGRMAGRITMCREFAIDRTLLEKLQQIRYYRSSANQQTAKRCITMWRKKN